MKISLPNPMCDAHVHFGQCGLTGLRFGVQDVERLIRRFGIEKMLLFPFDMELHASNCQVLRLAKHISQVTPLLRVPSEIDDEFLTLLTHSLDIIGGLKFHPSMTRKPITDESLTPLFRMLEEHGKIALIHCGRWEQVSSFRFVSMRASLHPKMKFIMAHMGGNELANTQGAILDAKEHPNIYLETSNCRIGLMIRKAVSEMGDDRILFGSDTPWGCISANTCTVLDAGLSIESQGKIMHDNLQGICGE